MIPKAWAPLHHSVVDELPPTFMLQPAHIQAALVHHLIGNQIGQRWQQVKSERARQHDAAELNKRRDPRLPRIQPLPAPTTPANYLIDVSSPPPGPTRLDEIRAAGSFGPDRCDLCGAIEDFGVLGDATRHLDLSRR